MLGVKSPTVVAEEEADKLLGRAIVELEVEGRILASEDSVAMEPVRIMKADERLSRLDEKLKGTLLGGAVLNSTLDVERVVITLRLKVARELALMVDCEANGLVVLKVVKASECKLVRILPSMA